MDLQSALDDTKELDRAKAVNAALMVRILSSWASTQREHERAHTHTYIHI